MAAGFAGAYAIARHRSGLAGWLMLLGWFLLPFVLFAAWTYYDLHELGASASEYDQAVPLMVIYMAMIAVPWGIANLLGALTGRQKRRGSAGGTGPAA